MQVAMGGVTLYQPDEQVGPRIHTDALAATLRSIMSALPAVVGAAASGPYSGAFVFAVAPQGRSLSWWVTDPAVSLPSDAIEIEVPEVTDGPVVAAVRFTVGDSPPLERLPVPEAWREIAAKWGGEADVDTIVGELLQA